jgi:hypothetical protein
MNEAGIAEAVAKLTAGKKLVVTTVTTYEIVGGGELKAVKAAKEPKAAKPKGKRGRPKKKVETKIEEAKPKRKAGRPVGSGKKKLKKAPAVKKPKGRPKGTGKKPAAKAKPVIVPVPAEVAALINKLGKTKLGQIAKNVKVIKKAYKRNSPIINLCKKVSSSTGKAKSEMYGVLKTAIKALAAGKTVKTEGSATAAPVPATK